ncbi:DUF5063 domain-containing protein [Saccharicrinis sp. FJH54]|uniref:DUF5063 domain-containing protein n=1 Tax=Saccharicrinis sp. FJH54 TaxID=3344665 RepID=UPI0035D4DE33
MNDLLLENIDKLIEYGQGEVNISEDDKIENLEYLLISIYKQILELPKRFDDTNKECPKIDYEVIKKQVEKNFSNFGYYNTVFNGIENFDNPETVVGDSIDDLADIIKDLIEAKWYFENSSPDDAIWQIKFDFESHFRYHILGLLKYLHDIKK